VLDGVPNADVLLSWPHLADVASASRSGLQEVIARDVVVAWYTGSVCSWPRCADRCTRGRSSGVMLPDARATALRASLARAMLCHGRVHFRPFERVVWLQGRMCTADGTVELLELG
jgi:hypothetical protein